jgi:hypothetical protein
MGGAFGAVLAGLSLANIGQLRQDVVNRGGAHSAPSTRLPKSSIKAKPERVKACVPQTYQRFLESGISQRLQMCELLHPIMAVRE